MTCLICPAPCHYGLELGHMMQEATLGVKEASGGFEAYGWNTLRGSAQPSLKASCGHEDRCSSASSGWRGPAGLLQRPWAVIPQRLDGPAPRN